jgi:ferredoxin
MIANFGYKDATGEFYIAIDTDKCDGCGDCVPVCPSNVLEVRDNEFDPMADDEMAAVTEDQRKKLAFACSECKILGADKIPCVLSCPKGAIVHSW